MKKIDLTGQRFGHLTVLREDGHMGKDVAWLCQCDCGNQKRIRGDHLRRGVVTSCGCYLPQVLRKRNTTHSGTGTKLFNIWMKTKAVCYTKTNGRYYLHGGKGIKVYSDWLGENGFANFQSWAYEHNYSDGMELKRCDLDKDFCPENCFWEIPKTHAEYTSHIEFDKREFIDGEEWRDIKGLEGHYQISNLGRLRSIDWIDDQGRHFKGQIITPFQTKQGYLRKSFTINGKIHLCSVHRLVAEAFIPNPNNYPIINHKDENPLNNRVENLEWCDYKYNSNYSEEIHGYHKRKIMMLDMNGNPIKCFDSIVDGANYVGLKNSSDITSCCHGRSKTAGGYKWQYAS